MRSAAGDGEEADSSAVQLQVAIQLQRLISLQIRPPTPTTVKLRAFLTSTKEPTTCCSLLFQMKALQVVKDGLQQTGMADRTTRPSCLPALMPNFVCCLRQLKCPANSVSCVAHGQQHSSMYSANSRWHHCRTTAAPRRVPLSKLRDMCWHRHQDSQTDEAASPHSSSSTVSASSSLSSAETQLLNSFAPLQSLATTVDSSSIDSHHMAQGHAHQVVLDNTRAVSAGSQPQPQSSANSAKMSLSLEQERPAADLPPASSIPR